MEDNMATKKNLKYRDLPWDLKRRIDASGPMMQPRKSENPTVKNILDRLKASEQRALATNSTATASQKREIIVLIEKYLIKNNFNTSRPQQPEL